MSADARRSGKRSGSSRIRGQGAAAGAGGRPDAGPGHGSIAPARPGGSRGGTLNVLSEVGSATTTGVGVAMLSACLITLNEAAHIGRCLASLAGHVDGIVVYDTGSTDGTPSAARDTGATVEEGYWDGSFARARNRSLGYCTTEWVLSIDADEEFHWEGDSSLTEYLRRLGPRGVDAVEVPIDNVLLAHGSPTAQGPIMTHTAVRLFRREAVNWAGDLHEEPLGKDGAPLQAATIPGLRITHFGYAISREASRRKALRNLEAIGQSGSRPEPSDPTTLLKIARTHWAVGDLEAALDELRQVLAAAERGSRVEWLAARSAVQVALWLDRPEEAGHFAAVMNEGRPGQAQWEEGLPAPVFDFIVTCASGNVSGSADLAKALAKDNRLLAVAQALNIGPASADLLLERAWQLFTGREERLAILASASRVASRLDAPSASRWSARLRAEGAAELCPLVAMAMDGSRPAAQRIEAARIAAETFRDPRGRELAAQLGKEMGP